MNLEVVINRYIASPPIFTNVAVDGRDVEMTGHTEEQMPAPIREHVSNDLMIYSQLDNFKLTYSDFTSERKAIDLVGRGWF